MQTVIQHRYAPAHSQANSKPSLWKRFMTWSDQQEKNRLGWTAFAIAGHGCVFTIFTVMVVLLTGNNFIFWPFIIGAMAACLIVNLAAMPTKITIPVLFLSLLIDVAIIAISLFNGFDMEAMYR